MEHYSDQSMEIARGWDPSDGNPDRHVCMVREPGGLWRQYEIQGNITINCGKKLLGVIRRSTPIDQPLSYNLPTEYGAVYGRSKIPPAHKRREWKPKKNSKLKRYCERRKRQMAFANPGQTYEKIWKCSFLEELSAGFVTALHPHEAAMEYYRRNPQGYKTCVVVDGDQFFEIAIQPVYLSQDDAARKFGSKYKSETPIQGYCASCETVALQIEELTAREEKARNYARECNERITKAKQERDELMAETIRLMGQLSEFGEVMIPFYHETGVPTQLPSRVVMAAQAVQVFKEIKEQYAREFESMKQEKWDQLEAIKIACQMQMRRADEAEIRLQEATNEAIAYRGAYAAACEPLVERLKVELHELLMRAVEADRQRDGMRPDVDWQKTAEQAQMRVVAAITTERDEAQSELEEASRRIEHLEKHESTKLEMARGTLARVRKAMEAGGWV